MQSEKAQQMRGWMEATRFEFPPQLFEFLVDEHAKEVSFAVKYSMRPSYYIWAYALNLQAFAQNGVASFQLKKPSGWCFPLEENPKVKLRQAKRNEQQRQEAEQYDAWYHWWGQSRGQ